LKLTNQQIDAVEREVSAPPQIMNPRTRETFVLLPIDEYRRLKENEYDDSPWTREELETLAWEAATRNGICRQCRTGSGTTLAFHAAGRGQMLEDGAGAYLTT